MMERGQTTLNKYVKALLHRDWDKCKRRLIDRRMKTAAFTEGKRLDEIEQARESGKRPYQRILLVKRQIYFIKSNFLMSRKVNAKYIRFNV